MGRPTGQSAIDVILAGVEPASADLGAMSSPDGAVTLVVGDIADAAGIRERVGAETWATTIRTYRSLMERLLQAHDGTLVKSEDDGFLAVFASAHRGLSWALEMQRLVTGQTISDAEVLKLRVGVHTGFVIVNTSDYFGRNVILAARLADRAKGGETLGSSAVHEYTQTDPRFRFMSRGEFRLKGLLGEHEVFAVGWA